MLSQRRHYQYKAAGFPLESHKESRREVLKEYESAIVESVFFQITRGETR